MKVVAYVSLHCETIDDVEFPISQEPLSVTYMYPLKFVIISPDGVVMVGSKIASPSRFIYEKNTL